MTVIVTRDDDVNIPVTLKTDGSTDDVSSATSIRAALTSRDGQTQYGVQTQVIGTPGADWANGLVVVLFSVTQTDTLPTGGIRLEVETIVAGARQSYYFDGIEGRIGTLS